MTAPSALAARVRTLGWAAFVACSWTWCIGMYLPVLLVRDFGDIGWIVFTVPNVIGAAALGWILQRPGSAAALSRDHWPAAVAFSLVTVLFHAYFAGFVLWPLVGAIAPAVVATGAALVYWIGRRGQRDLGVAAALLLISAALFIVAATSPGRLHNGAIEQQPPLGLVWLSPVIVFGFLLNPYLDLTFLRARAATAPLSGIAAFTLGFGVFFLGMLLFTLWYSRLVQPAVLHGLNLPSLVRWAIAGHMMIQSGFTIAVHTRAIGEDRRLRKVSNGAIRLAALVGVYLAGTVGGETGYRLILGFYGLVFPTYVWLCMIPTRRAIPAQSKLRVLAITLLLAGPMFWLGFIDNRLVWLAPGIAIVLLARLALVWAGSPGASRGVRVKVLDRTF